MEKLIYTPKLFSTYSTHSVVLFETGYTQFPGSKKKERGGGGGGQESQILDTHDPDQ